MPIELLATIAAFTGAAFCFVIAAADAAIKPAPSNAHDMLNLFGITPNNADEFMH